MISELDESELAHVDPSVSPLRTPFSFSLARSSTNGGLETLVAAKDPEDGLQVREYAAPEEEPYLVAVRGEGGSFG